MIAAQGVRVCLCARQPGEQQLRLVVTQLVEDELASLSSVLRRKAGGLKRPPGGMGGGSTGRGVAAGGVVVAGGRAGV